MNRLRELLDKKLSAMRDDHSPGLALLVSRAGREILREVRGAAEKEDGSPISVHTVFDAGSIAKTVTGLCVAMLEDEGRLTLDTTLQEALPELPEWASRVTLGHLLRHESGLHNYTTMLYYMAGYHPHNPPTAQEVLEFLGRSGGPKWKPGSRYEYLDTNYFLLAQVVERVAGSPFGQFAEQRVFRPLGMKDSYMTDGDEPSGAEVAEGYTGYPMKFLSPHAFRTTSEEGLFPVRLRYRHVGAEGFRTSVSDLARLGREILKPSMASAETMARIVSPSRVRGDGLGYGYGLNVGTFRGLDFIGHDGMIQGFTASMSVFREHNLVIACLANREDLGAWEFRNLILGELLGVQAPRSQSSLRVAGCLPEPRLGLYMDPASSSFLELTRDQGKLMASVNGGELQPISYVVQPSEAAQREQDVGSVEIDSDGDARCFHPFAEYVDCTPYEGDYVCEALQTTFRVEALGTGVRLTHADPNHPSMDLDYSPTIEDFFWSHDPHPGISQLEFLRDQGCVIAFRYRDYDGDGREAFVLLRN